MPATENSTQLRKDAMIKALEQTLGVVKPACDMVGISRQSHYNWMKEDESYKASVEDIVEVMLDYLESKAMKLVNDGDTAMTIFMLKTRAKKRGYVERTEQDINVTGAPIQIIMPPDESTQS